MGREGSLSPLRRAVFPSGRMWEEGLLLGFASLLVHLILPHGPVCRVGWVGGAKGAAGGACSSLCKGWQWVAALLGPDSVGLQAAQQPLFLPPLVVGGLVRAQGDQAAAGGPEVRGPLDR